MGSSGTHVNCASNPPAQFASACDALRDDLHIRDFDTNIAIAGAVAAGVGIGATVVAYFVSSPAKGRDQTAVRLAIVPRISPWITRQDAGLGIRGTF